MRTLYARYRGRTSAVVPAVILTFFSAWVTAQSKMWMAALFDRGILEKNFPQLVYYSVLFLVFTGLYYLLEFIIKRIYLIQGREISMRLKQDLFEEMMQKRMNLYAEKGAGYFTSVLLNDTDNLYMMVSGSFAKLISSVMTVAVILFYLFRINIRLTLITIVIVPFYYLAIRALNARIEKNAFRKQEGNEKLNAHIIESHRMMEMIRANNWQKKMADEFGAASEAYRASSLGTTMAMQSMNLSYQGIIMPYISLVTLIGGYWCVRGQLLTIGELIAFTSMVYLIVMPVMSAIEAYGEISRSKSSDSRIEDFKRQTKEDQNGQETLSHIESIRFENVDFSYGKEPILQGFNLTLRTGEKCLLTGRTGSGKSTLVRLLLGFISPQKGTIYINEKPYASYALRAVRDRLAYVPQKGHLLGDDLNAHLQEQTPDGDPDLALAIGALEDEAKEWRSAKDQDIPLEKRLSGGQLQRLTLAKAFMKQADVYLFDEPTSAVDPQKEQQIFRALAENTKDKIVLMVSHNPVSEIDFDHHIHFEK